MARDVEDLLMSAAETGPYIPMRQTLWPRSARLRSRFSTTLLSELSQLAEHHAEPELFDHLFLYADRSPLLEYPDAFLRGSVVYVASSIAQEELCTWASGLQLEAQWCAA
jgi:hypothetical protein